MGPQMQKYLWWKRYLTQLQFVSKMAANITRRFLCLTGGRSGVLKQWGKLQKRVGLGVGLFEGEGEGAHKINVW